MATNVFDFGSLASDDHAFSAWLKQQNLIKSEDACPECCSVEGILLRKDKGFQNTVKHSSMYWLSRSFTLISLNFNSYLDAPVTTITFLSSELLKLLDTIAALGPLMFPGLKMLEKTDFTPLETAIISGTIKH